MGKAGDEKKGKRERVRKKGDEKRLKELTAQLVGLTTELSESQRVARENAERRLREQEELAGEAQTLQAGYRRVEAELAEAARQQEHLLGELRVARAKLEGFRQQAEDARRDAAADREKVTLARQHVEHARAEAAQARLEAAEARQHPSYEELEQARLEAAQARIEAEQAWCEAELAQRALAQLRRELDEIRRLAEGVPPAHTELEPVALPEVPGLEVRYDRVLPLGERAPMIARRAVGVVLAKRLPPETLDDARLAVSELVTNAVLHGLDQVEGPRLRILAGSDAVRIEVRNRSAAFDFPLVSPELLAESGRGLFIVRAVAAATGIEEEGPIIAVWCTFESPDRELVGEPVLV